MSWKGAEVTGISRNDAYRLSHEELETASWTKILQRLNNQSLDEIEANVRVTASPNTIISKEVFVSKFCHALQITMYENVVDKQRSHDIDEVIDQLYATYAYLYAKFQKAKKQFSKFKELRNISSSVEEIIWIVVDTCIKTLIIKVTEAWWEWSKRKLFNWVKATLLKVNKNKRGFEKMWYRAHVATGGSLDEVICTFPKEDDDVKFTLREIDTAFSSLNDVKEYRLPNTLWIVWNIFFDFEWKRHYIGTYRNTQTTFHQSGNAETIIAWASWAFDYDKLFELHNPWASGTRAQMRSELDDELLWGEIFLLKMIQDLNQELWIDTTKNEYHELVKISPSVLVQEERRRKPEMIFNIDITSLIGHLSNWEVGTEWLNEIRNNILELRSSAVDKNETTGIILVSQSDIKTWKSEGNTLGKHFFMALLGDSKPNWRKKNETIIQDSAVKILQL